MWKRYFTVSLLSIALSFSAASIALADNTHDQCFSITGSGDSNVNQSPYVWFSDTPAPRWYAANGYSLQQNSGSANYIQNPDFSSVRYIGSAGNFESSIWITGDAGSPTPTVTLVDCPTPPPPPVVYFNSTTTAPTICTTTGSTTSCDTTGSTFEEILVEYCVLLFFVSFIGWRAIFSGIIEV